MAITHDHELAQLNVGRLRAPIDSPDVAEFVDNLDRINALAEVSAGFVWRLKDENNNATGIATPFGPEVIANMSIWDGIDSLRRFVFRTEHARFVRRRREWFVDYGRPYLVLWWIRAGHRPSLDEAAERLELLERSGPTDRAFTFAQKFDAFGNRQERLSPKELSRWTAGPLRDGSPPA